MAFVGILCFCDACCGQVLGLDERYDCFECQQNRFRYHTPHDLPILS